MADVVDLSDARRPSAEGIKHPQNLKNIPGHLRALADRIEKGDLTDVETCIVMAPQPAGLPRLFVYGHHSQAELVFALSKALVWQSTCETER